MICIHIIVAIDYASIRAMKSQCHFDQLSLSPSWLISTVMISKRDGISSCNAGCSAI